MLDTNTNRLPPKNRNGLTFPERMAIYERLGALLTKDGGFVRYEKGWDDATVAAWASQVLGRAVTRYNVAGVRRMGYGNLRDMSAAPETKPVDLEARVANLEDRLDRLVAALGGL